MGVDLLVATSFSLWILRDSGMKWPGPTLLVRLRETGSALDMQLALHKQLAGVCLSHYSYHLNCNGRLVDFDLHGVHALNEVNG